MTRSRDRWLAAVGLSIPVATTLGELTGHALLALAILAFAVVLGWIATPGFFR